MINRLRLLLLLSRSKVADKYHQPRWCPEGLTHTHKRKLQRLRNKEKREQEAEKARDEYFNKYRPMIPQSKVWQVKTVDQPAEGPVELTPVTGQTCASDRSNRPEPPVRPVEPSAESTTKSAVPVSVSRVDEVEPAPPAKEDESWWIMRHLRSTTIWRLTTCICLRITS